ncbi:cleft lip and palate transmembrane 1 [Neocallimastix lanati (nom. inval.)]|nr:cleft lip and palate transmembrane 1 [Neocallimastix sp. JGI-2020a]
MSDSDKKKEVVENNQPVKAEKEKDQPQQQRQEEKKNTFKELLPTIARMVFFFMLYKFMSQMAANKVNQRNNNTSQPSTQFTNSQNQQSSKILPNQNPNTNPNQNANVNNNENYMYKNLWKINDKTRTDLYLYLSENEIFKEFRNENKLLWKINDIKFKDWNESYTKDFEIELPDSVLNNGTYYLHAFFVLNGYSPDPSSPNFDRKKITYNKKLLTKYKKKKKVVIKKKLFSKDDEEKTEVIEKPKETEEDKDLIISYWYPELIVNYLPDTHMIDLRQLQPDMYRDLILFENKRYHPIVYMNDFWQLNEHELEINKTSKKLPLKIDVYPLSFVKYSLYVSMDYSFKVNSEMLGGDTNEFDEIKRMLRETNPILLGVTFTVSIVHSIFDFLAFSNDVKFWKERKDMVGLSLRSLLMNIFTQTVIFLYLLDNETSWMVIISNAVGLVIEIWKIHKVVNIKFDTSGTIPKIKFETRVKNEKVDKTNEYDVEAFKYFQYLMWPLLAGYVIYSLINNEYKGWYSFIISTLVGFVYMFGFLSLLPQLFINYKLKSVEHMPWKSFMYKALNTFIDDLFAFCIKMPTLHRIACLRDDVVFFVYLYQRWIYPVDHSRRNEFGQVDEKALKEKLEHQKEAENEKETKKTK